MRMHKADRHMTRQSEPDSGYGITRGQACVMCHLSSECPRCCEKCRAEGRNGTCYGQACSRPTRDTEGERREAWMHSVRVRRPDLRRFVPEIYLRNFDTKAIDEAGRKIIESVMED